jgi:integrase
MGQRQEKTRTWIPEANLNNKQIAKELERQKLLIEDEVRNGSTINGDIRFSIFAERWMTEYAKMKLAPKTVQRYEDFLKRINPAIGHIKLNDLKPIHLNAFYRNLEEDDMKMVPKHGTKGKAVYKGKLAAKTILEHHRLISKILSTAVKWLIIENNVASRADPPKPVHHEVESLDEVEVREMFCLLAAEPIQYRTMIMLLVYTGMRRGELAGLEWKDVDFDKKQISVVRSSQYIGNKQLIAKEPKTHSGHRKITIGVGVCTLLQEYKRWQSENRLKLGDQWANTDRLFTQWNGAPIYPDTISAWFTDFIHRKGLRKVSLHSLRHTHATLLISEGTDIRTVSSRLGHAQTSTTLNIYAHALKSKDAEAAERLDNLLVKSSV